MKIEVARIIQDFRPHMCINDTIIASKNCDIFGSSDLGNSWEFRYRVPVEKYIQVLSGNRSITRLLRLGIRKIQQISSKKILIFSCGKIFLSDLDFSFCEEIHLGKRYFETLDHSLCVTPNFLYYGEYIPNFRRTQDVHIYRSRDGLDWDVVFSFPKKTVRHVHLLQFDSFLNRIWFSTGDEGNECILGTADEDFTEIEIVGKNDQIFRTLEMVFEKDAVYWATEDPLHQNRVVRLARADKKITTLAAISSPVYNFKKFGDLYLLITANEGRDIDKSMHVYATSDLESGRWDDCISFTKDPFPAIFGFGRLYFGCKINEYILLYGYGLAGADNRTIVMKLEK